ncbi:MAG: DNA polymerase-3 subunit chi [Pseudohongiellaceae bacterium]|jgi:DNA polymerase-3 subunit chi
MASVHFYTLNSQRYESGDVLNVVCRLTEKAVSHQHAVYIYTSSSSQSQQLDDLLWQFRSPSFVPHGQMTGPDAHHEQVMLGDSLPPESFKGMLINLSSAPVSAAQFSRVNEFVGPDETSLVAGRERYRHYKAQGVDIVTNKI